LLGMLLYKIKRTGVFIPWKALFVGSGINLSFSNFTIYAGLYGWVALGKLFSSKPELHDKRSMLVILGLVAVGGLSLSILVI